MPLKTEPRPGPATFWQGKKSVGGLAGCGFATSAAFMSDKILPDGSSPWQVVALCLVCALPAVFSVAAEWTLDMRRLRYAHEERMAGVENPMSDTRRPLAPAPPKDNANEEPAQDEAQAAA